MVMKSSPSFRIAIIIFMIIAGAMNTLNDKYQNKHYVTEGQYTNKYFYHPFMQTALMFIGEFLALPIYYIHKRRNPEPYAKRLQLAKEQGKIIEFNKMIIGVRAIIDLVTSTLQSIALNFVEGSVYQMMRGGTVATTFLFSLVFLKMSAQRHQIFGSLLTVVGILIVGASNLLMASSNDSIQNTTLEVVGYILLIGSLFSNGFQFVYEENLFAKYHIEPIYMVGVEGAFGLTTYILILAGISFVPCSFGEEACVFTDDSRGFLERPDVYFRQLGENPQLIGLCCLYVFSIMVFNFCGLSITKYINALARAICDVTRTVIVWVVGIIITLTLGAEQKNFNWQSTEGSSISLQLLGFVIIVFGNLIYNQVLNLACLSKEQPLDQNTLVQQHE